MNSITKFNSNYIMNYNDVIIYIIILFLVILTIILYFIYKIYTLQIEIYKAINIDLQDKIRLKEEADKLRIEMIEKSRAKIDELYKVHCAKDVELCLKHNLVRTHYYKYIMVKKAMMSWEERGYSQYGLHLIEDCMRD